MLKGQVDLPGSHFGACVLVKLDKVFTMSGHQHRGPDSADRAIYNSRAATFNKVNVITGHNNSRIDDDTSPGSFIGPFLGAGVSG